jgi:hypothetical protein
MGGYFKIGASLGSIVALVVLAVVWFWLAAHMGGAGLMLGWIPAGLIAVLVWLVMVVFWAPILVIVAIALIGVVMVVVLPGHGRSREEPPAAEQPDDRTGPPDAESMPESFPPARSIPPPLASSGEPAGEAASGAPAPSTAPRPKPRPHRVEPPPTDDLGSDAAAAGDTTARAHR